MFFLCLSLYWIYLSHLTKGADEKRSPGWVMAAVYIVSRARCSKWINIIGSNLCLDFKNTVYAPYALVRTRLKKHMALIYCQWSNDLGFITKYISNNFCLP